MRRDRRLTTRCNELSYHIEGLPVFDETLKNTVTL